MPERLEFRYSPQGQLALAVVSCVLVAGATLVVVTSADIVYRGFGWFSIVFFTLCTMIAVKRRLGGGTPFVFELGGIAFPSGKFGVVPWTEIKDYSVVNVRGNYFLALTFYHPDRILSRMSFPKRRWAMVNHRLGWGHWALSFSGLDHGLDEAVKFIQEHSLVRTAAQVRV